MAIWLFHAAVAGMSSQQGSKSSDETCMPFANPGLSNVDRLSLIPEIRAGC